MKPTSVRQCSRSSRHRAFARAIALVAALCALAFANFATAQTTLNFNVSSGDWDTAGNWSPAQLPTSVDTVYINTYLTSSITATIGSGDSGEASVVRVGDGGRKNGTLEVNGTLTAGSDVTVGHGSSQDNPSQGTLNQGDSSTVTIGGNLEVGSQYTSWGTGGVYTMGSGASLTLNGTTSDLLIGYGRRALGSFTCNGTLDVAQNVVIGQSDSKDHVSVGSFAQGDSTEVTIGGSLTVGDYASSSASYTQGANSSVSVGGDLSIGRGWNTAGASYTVPETGTLTLGAASNVYIAYGDNARGDFEFNSTTATLAINDDVTIAYSGNTSYKSQGSFTQGDGTTVTIGGALTVGSNNSNTTDSGGVLTLGDGASLSVTGATSVATASLSLGKFSLSGGTASLSTLSMGSAGTIEGYGTISGTTLTMNGTVRASGGTLDLSGFTTVENTSGTGWFVENGGAITLPTTAVAAGDGGDFIWGERAVSVNSVQLDFTQVDGGDLRISVLDPDTGSYLPGFGTPSPTTGSIVSLWEIDPWEIGGTEFTFGDNGTVDLVFRYDESRLAELGISDETELKVYHYTGAEWELLDTTINTTAHTASVAGITSFSPFAVGINISGAIPEPASLALLTLGTAWLLNRRRGRSTTGIPACRPAA
jgi:hypothetical protein